MLLLLSTREDPLDTAISGLGFYLACVAALSSPPLRWPLLTHAALPHQHQHQQSRTGGQGSNISHNNTVHSEAADQQ